MTNRNTVLFGGDPWAPFRTQIGLATNILTDPYGVSDFTATRLTANANAAVGPGGAATAESLIPSVDNNNHNITTATGFAKAASVIRYVLGFSLKAAGYPGVRATLNNTGLNAFARADFNASNGTFTPQSNAGSWVRLSTSMKRLKDGWWWCEMLADSDTDTTVKVAIYVLDASLATNYVGDTTSGVLIDGKVLRVVG